jgi:hypothetical protein
LAPPLSAQSIDRGGALSRRHTGNCPDAYRESALQGHARLATPPPVPGAIGDRDRDRDHASAAAL